MEPRLISALFQIKIWAWVSRAAGTTMVGSSEGASTLLPDRIPSRLEPDQGGDRGNIPSVLDGERGGDRVRSSGPSHRPEAPGRRESDASLAQVASLLSVDHFNLAVVCGPEEAMAGVVTDSDVVRAIADCAGSAERACCLSASTSMTREVVSCRPNDDVHQVWDRMNEHGLRHIPVLDDEDKPIGVLYGRDILDHLLDEQKIEARDIRDFFLGVGYR